MLRYDTTALLVIDFQDKLLDRISGKEAIVPRVVKLLRFARELGIPVVGTEQYPKGLGPTTKAIADELPADPPIEKTVFGCMDAPGFRETLDATGRKQLLVTGIEAHICVMQTVLPAIEAGFEVYVARDAVGSREDAERDAGLQRMAAHGAEIVTAEMAMFESVREAGTPEFKKILPLVK